MKRRMPEKARLVPQNMADLLTARTKGDWNANRAEEEHENKKFVFSTGSDTNAVVNASSYDIVLGFSHRVTRVKLTQGTAGSNATTYEIFHVDSGSSGTWFSGRIAANKKVGGWKKPSSLYDPSFTETQHVQIEINTGTGAAGPYRLVIEYTDDPEE